MQRTLRLSSLKSERETLICSAKIDAPDGTTTVYLPNSPGVQYVLLPKKGMPLSVKSSDFLVEVMSCKESLGARLRRLLIFKKKKTLRFPRFSIFAVGPRPDRKVFSAVVRRMLKSGAALDEAVIQKFPELLLGWKPKAAATVPLSREGKPAASIAIVVHIHYEETWSQIATILRDLNQDYDLIVTMTPGKERLANAIYHEFPWADVHVFENRGRDVRAFLLLLENGSLERYRYVCKIHGKKSHDGGRIAALGAIWRNRMLFDLLAAPNVVTTIIDCFNGDPKIGMIGSAAYRYPNSLCSEKLSWGENRPLVLNLAKKMGIPPDRFKLDFFCGTMFWVRPAVLRPLRDLGLSNAFSDETGKLDGALEHAVERLFSAATIASGYRIEDVTGFQPDNSAAMSIRDTEQIDV